MPINKGMGILCDCRCPQRFARKDQVHDRGFPKLTRVCLRPRTLKGPNQPYRPSICTVNNERRRGLAPGMKRDVPREQYDDSKKGMDSAIGAVFDPMAALPYLAGDSDARSGGTSRYFKLLQHKRRRGQHGDHERLPALVRQRSDQCDHR